MFKKFALIAMILPFAAKAQIQLAKHYVDDRINEDTFLRFDTDSTFYFRYAYDTMGDEAIGHYKRHNDSLFLHFNKDTLISGSHFFYKSTGNRVDSLIIKGHVLYEIRNGKSREYEPQDSVHHKPPRSWHFRRKYLIFGPFESTYTKYYMVDERYAKWKKWRRRSGIK